MQVTYRVTPQNSLFVIVVRRRVLTSVSCAFDVDLRACQMPRQLLPEVWRDGQSPTWRIETCH